jgi:hypothetical protein
MKLKNQVNLLVSSKNGITNSYPLHRENLDTEILIVGGGITGSLIAHQCIGGRF